MADIIKEGTVAFFAQHDHQDWDTNANSYKFPKLDKYGVSVEATKERDCTFKVVVDGALGKRFVFQRPTPQLGPDGVHVIVRWSGTHIDLILNGAVVETKTV